MGYVQQRNVESLVRQATQQAETNPEQAAKTLRIARSMMQRLGNRGMTVALGKAEDELRSRGTIAIGTRKTIKLGARTQTMKVGPGDDLASLIAAGLAAGGIGLVEGDVLVVTQKVVSKAEARTTPAADRDAVIEAETKRVVARRGDLVIVETAHGFVCANAGVDASNVADGLLTLLPEDPDASARRLRDALTEQLGIRRLGVVITDTFGLVRAGRKSSVTMIRLQPMR